MTAAFRTVYGVDFSGAKLAGRNIWIATARVPENDASPLQLEELLPLEQLAGTAEREPALAHLVGLIRDSDQSLWGIDFPFGLPVEMFPEATWAGQLAHLQKWAEPANALGTWCVARARSIGREMHIRRVTDTYAKTPFDCYHYRIIYQTFHGMRDVLLPLSDTRATAILPFQYCRLPRARRVIVEACPSSTLKRLGLPYQNYKQPAGGPLTARRRDTRRTIVAGLRPLIEIPAHLLRRAMRNPGGDALDAIIAAVGTQQGFAAADHVEIRRHARFPREGWLYV